MAGVDALASVPTAVCASPQPQTVPSLLDGWRQAERYAAEHANCEVFVGQGDSMLPLYRDHTVLVVEAVPMGELQAGMTVVFTGDRGRLVAHTLLQKTLLGWSAIGLGNHEPDRTCVCRRNLVGVVVKAFAPGLPGRLVAAQ
jgi:hypothetical protein